MTGLREIICEGCGQYESECRCRLTPMGKARQEQWDAIGKSGSERMTDNKETKDLQTIREDVAKLVGEWTLQPQWTHGLADAFLRYVQQPEVFKVLAAMQSSTEPDIIEDGFGNEWSAYCPMCGKKTMSVVRPGQVQCSQCG